MSAPRQGAAGATRPCPHCKAVILESSAVCPACRGHLRFDAPTTDLSQHFVPLQVEGTVRGEDSGSFEYTMLVVVRDENGKELSRHVAGVGAVHPGEARSFSVTVEAVPAALGKRKKH